MLSACEISIGLESNDHITWDLSHLVLVWDSPTTRIELLTMTALFKAFLN